MIYTYNHNGAAVKDSLTNWLKFVTAEGMLEILKSGDLELSYGIDSKIEHNHAMREMIRRSRQND